MAEDDSWSSEAADDVIHKDSCHSNSSDVGQSKGLDPFCEKVSDYEDIFVTLRGIWERTAYVHSPCREWLLYADWREVFTWSLS